jgi:hypothetical protein
MKRIGVIFVVVAFVAFGFLKPSCAFAKDV